MNDPAGTESPLATDPTLPRMVYLRDRKVLATFTPNERREVTSDYRSDTRTVTIEYGASRVVEVPSINPVRQMAKQWGCTRKEAERRMAALVNSHEAVT